MKILRIIYDWPPPWQGLSPHPYELTKAQSKLGHIFDIFCGRWSKSGEIAQVEGVRFHTFSREPLPGTLNLFNSVWLLFAYIFWVDDHEVDIVHSHGHFGIWIYGYRLLLKRFIPKARELKIPLVVHFHNTVEGRKQALKEKGAQISPVSTYLSWPLARLSDRWAVQVADACIFVSTDNLEEAVKYYKADRSKCFIVESGVNPEKFCSVDGDEKEKTRKELRINVDDKVILYSGVFSERKGVHLVVEALKYLPRDYKLLLVGSGDSRYQVKLDTLIEENHLESRIINSGYTPYPHTHIVFQIADIFVLASSFEGLPKVVLQSLACRVPALASGFKLKEEINGLHYINNLNAEEIARQIKEIVEAPRDVDMYKMQKLYSWEQKAREVEGIYKFVRGAAT